MVNDESKREAFESGWSKAMSFPPPPPMPEGSFGEFVGDVGFAMVWNRGQLTTRERRMVILTVLAMFGRDDITRMHMGSALDLGDLTSADLEEMAVTIATYGGFPRGVAFNSLRQALVGERTPGGD
ncbi:MAG: carboxymuconolactone decarboxylase [Acidimicrobiia bacterium]|nr:carboxymuconolactone decarboxylase [Acidimicrobiia bacterium]